MKIGILTFHLANNLGAVLQASALQKYVNDESEYCEVIDLYPNNAIPHRGNMIRGILRFGKNVLSPIKTHRQTKKELRFKEYRSKYIRTSSETYYGDKNIYINPPKYDVLISGSDQILNTTLTGNTTAYYLSFDNVAKKITYASSFGREEISDLEKNLVRQEFPKFSYISVREESGKHIIKHQSGLDSELVLDPVFLLDKTEWESRCSSNLKIPKKYIFVYSMENSEILEQAVDKIRYIYKMPVLLVRGGGTANRIVGKEDRECGPAEFLSYIKNAELIITNSFHGCAFSILFEKKFISIAHSTRNTRLANLMSLIGCDGLQVASVSQTSEAIKHIIDGKKAMISLEPMIRKSKSFLKRALE